jgi:copper chaperone
MKLQFKIPEMSCGGCLSTISKVIKTVDANATIQGDPQTKIVLVDTKSAEPEIKAALARAGYPAN